MPEASKILYSNMLPGSNSILTWDTDKSQDMELKALKPLGKGLYRGKKKFDIYLTPGSPFIPKVNPSDGITEEEAGEIKELEAIRQEPPIISQILAKAYRIKGIMRPIFFNFKGVNVLLNPQAVASLDTDLYRRIWGPLDKQEMIYPEREKSVEANQLTPLSIADLMPQAILRRLTQAQLSYLAKTYYTLGHEEAESAGMKVALVMLIMMIVIIAFMAWKAGWV